MRYRLDPSVRRVGDGRILVGGSPTRMVRLTEAGAELVDRAARGESAGGSAGVDALLARLTAGGLLHPEPAPGTGPSAAEVTVVVPVRDRPEGLRRLLSSLAGGPRVARVVVVDDGSRDPVRVDPELVDAVARDGIELLRRSHPGGPAAARNAGAAAARTELVAFVDSDCTVAPDWLDALLAQLADPAVVAVAPRVAAVPGPGVLARYEADRSPLDLGAEPGRVEAGTRIGYVPSAALVVRRDALDGVGGFDEGLRVGEDVDLVWRLVEAGGGVRYDPRSTVWHDVRPDLAAWLTQRVQYGSSAAALDLRHPGAAAPAVLSPWSLLVCALVAWGSRRTAAAAAVVVAGNVVTMGRRLPGVPPEEVVRMVLGGHVGALRQLARASVRVWWPVTALGAASSRRARRWALLAVGVSAVDAPRDRTGPPERSSAAQEVERLGPARVAGLALLDDLAYGAGVWLGCLRNRSLRALVPVLGRRRDADDERRRGGTRRRRDG